MPFIALRLSTARRGRLLATPLSQLCLLLVLASLSFDRMALAQSAPGSALLAYESFSGVDGPLDQTNSGSGWAAGWSVQNHDQTTPGYNLASRNQLVYAGLLQAGNYAVGGSVYQTAGRSLNVSPSGPFAAYLSSGVIDTPGTTIWLSVLLRKDSTTNDELSITLLANGTPWWAAQGHVSIGYFGQSSNVNGNGYWSLKVDGTVYPTSVPVRMGEAAFLVLRIGFGPPDTATLYVNPTPGASDPGAAAAQASATDGLAFNSVPWVFPVTS